MVTKGLYVLEYSGLAHQVHPVGSYFLPPGSTVKSEMLSRSRAVATENLLPEVKLCDYSSLKKNAEA